MSREIYSDKENKIYITETKRKTVEISLEANDSLVCIRVNNISTLPDLVKKISSLQNVSFIDKDNK